MPTAARCVDAQRRCAAVATIASAAALMIISAPTFVVAEPEPDRREAGPSAVDERTTDKAGRHEKGRAGLTKPSEPSLLAPVYIPAGSRFHYRVIRAPLPTEVLGSTALAGLDAVAGSSDADSIGTTAALPSVLGRADIDLPGPDWPAAPFDPDTAAAGSMPFAAKANAGRSCKCATELGDPQAGRIAVLYATHSFTAGPEAERVTLLRLRARYRDGLVAYINGHEVARRNIELDRQPMSIARRPRGPEWETFHIPVIPGLLQPGENVLAVELRPSGHRLVPAIDLELSAAEQARIIRGPMVQRVDATSAVIAFETDLPTQAAVEYGPTVERQRMAVSAEGALAMRHRVTLTNLALGAPVHYRVVTGTDASAALSFYTAPAAGQVMRFAVYGDVRGGHDAHARIVASIIDEAPDFVLATGDMVLRGSDEADWQRFFAITRELMGRVPYYPVAGNHDLGRAGDERRRMSEIFTLWPGPPERPTWGHWYSFDVADIHIVVLDSNAYKHAEQLAWLERDLAEARARGVRASFAVTHDGPFSRGLHRGNRYATENYVPILVRYGVALLFSGHDHLYQRGHAHGLDYMVSGGGGAPLYRVRCGVAGRPKCRAFDGMQHVVSEHHYILITVYGSHIEACPKRPDRSPLEPCITYPLGT